MKGRYNPIPYLAAFAAALFLAFLSVPEPRVASQSEANLHQWSSLSLFNGLPSNNVRAISQTDDGVLWFGTDSGLARLAGRGAQKVPIGELDGKAITVMKTDGNDLWIGSVAGAGRIAGGNFSVLEGLAGETVKAMLVLEDSVVIAGPKGLYTVRKATGSIRRTPLDGSERTEISALLDESGGFIAGTLGRGIAKLEEGALKEVVTRPRPFFIKRIERDPSGRVWIGADTNNRSAGLFVREDDVRLLPVVPETIGSVSAISFGTEGRQAWVGTDTGGLFLIEEGSIAAQYTFSNTAGGLRSNRIHDVYVDRENTVWVGGDRGVSRLDTGSPRNELLSEDARGNFIRVFYEAPDGSIYTGTNRGLFRRGAGNWALVPGFESETVYSLGSDTDGNLLAGTRRGLLDAGGRLLIEGDVRGVGSLGGESYAAVFGKGLVTIDKESGDEEIAFRHDELTSLWPDDGGLILGTGKGELFTFDGAESERMPGVEKLNGAAIWRIRKSEFGLILATQKGLFIVRDGEVAGFLENLPVRDGVITGNGTDIWAATVQNGLYHFKADIKFGLLTSNIATEQGLPSSGVFALSPAENESLLIGTTDGASFYRPNRQPPRILPVRLLSQRLHTTAEMRSGIALDYPQNSLVLEVSGLSSRTFPEKFQYAFYLKDGKGDILRERLSGDPQFVMDELEAGDYQVEAFAFNQDLIASEPLRFQFSVSSAPFPWTSTALGTLLAVALIALTWAVFERRRIADINRKLTAARLDLANEAERERRRIARDLHDQTLADLRHLMLMSDKEPGGHSGFRAEIESVSEEIRRICEDLSPSVLENVGLFAAMEFLLSGSELETEFSLIEGSEDEHNLSIPVQMQIFRITQEAVTNIVRHANATKVKMRVAAGTVTGFLVELEDDGTVEFDPGAHTSEGRGLSNIRSRAELIGADVVWKSSDGVRGNLFRLSLSGRSRSHT